MESEPNLKEVVAEELKTRKGIFGENMPKLIEYLNGRLGNKYTKSQLQLAVNSLISKGEIVRKCFKPIPVGVDQTIGENGVIIYHGKFKDLPSTEFPKEFQDFLEQHHRYATLA